MRRMYLGMLAIGFCVALVVSYKHAAPEAQTYEWHLPPGFIPVSTPNGQPLDAAHVLLGRYLFYDQRLSANQTQSCAGCHQQQRAFTDGLPRAVGSTGAVLPHNTLGLFNAGYLPTFTWASHTITALHAQVLTPMFSTTPIEMGLAGVEDQALARFRNDTHYQELFAGAYPGDANPVTWTHVEDALATFTRTLVSGNSAYDRYVYGGDPSALSVAAQRGMRLFFSNELGCASCHTDISAPDNIQPPRFDLLSFQDTGMADPGPFRVPPLRNVAVTAPYMHDGSLASLEDVVRFYEKGGDAGRTRASKNGLVDGFVLTDNERQSLVAFLQALTDEQALHDPRFSNPFQQ